MSGLDAGGRAIAGVDGCKAGWIAVTLMPAGEPATAVFTSFAELVDGLPDDAVIAVDMPIGLPETTRKGGRGPEMLVRPLLGQRQSSVFSIPSRAAVYASVDAFATVELWYDAHRQASTVARTTSEPPRGVSIQAFGIFPKIREIDMLLRARSDLRRRVIESHPEVAFWRLNSEQAMLLPKKVKGQVSPAGMAERRALLCSLGLARDFVESAPPRGAAADDFLDAVVLLCVAARHARGEARPFPDPPGIDAHGVPIAIWV